MSRDEVPAGAPSRPGRTYLLLMLALVALSQQSDKILFSIALEPIKKELRLSDSQLGLLNGLAFAVFYALASLPLARLADRRGRKPVIAICLAAWSLFTGLTSLATGFVTLFASRVLVGVGEAGAGPAAQSMIAARFAPRRRPGALAWYFCGGYVGMVLGLWLGGRLVDLVGWRGAFLWLGVPGLALAAILFFTVEEPREAVFSEPSNWTQIAVLLRRPAYFHFFMVLATGALPAYGMLAWAPAFYMRDFAMTASSAGFWLGIAVGVGTIIGALAGGIAGDRLYAWRPRAALWLAFWTVLANAPLSVAVFLAPTRGLSLAFLMTSMVLGGVCVGPIYGALQDLIPPGLRTTVVATFGLGTVIVGQGLGPLLVGAVSDMTSGVLGIHSLKWALALVSAIGFWTVIHLYFVARGASRPQSASL